MASRPPRVRSTARFDLQSFYAPDEIDRANRELRDERLRWLQSFDGLDPSIVGVFAGSADHS